MFADTVQQRTFMCLGTCQSLTDSNGPMQKYITAAECKVISSVFKQTLPGHLDQGKAVAKGQIADL